MTLHSGNVWHLLHYTRHHILALWHQATILMTSHPLYLTSYPLCLCHHIHCIDDITPTEFLLSHPLYMMTSYPLYMTSQPENVCHHTHPFNDIAHFVCRISPPLYVYYHINFLNTMSTFYDITPHYLWHHSHYIRNGIHRIYVITTTLLMVSEQLYVWHHTHFMYAILCTLHNVTSTLYDFTPL